LALIANKVGDKQIALRHVRYLKIGLDGKAKCTGFMDRVEEVLGMISDAESTKKVKAINWMILKFSYKEFLFHKREAFK
jgi:hypothetical protein